MVKATTELIDVTRKGMTVAGDVAELQLFAEARWCKQMGQAGSLLGIVTTGFELIHIAQAYRDGEPDRVVQWQLVGGGLTVATAVLGFLSLTASLVLVIGVMSMVLGILFTELASQAMTLAQRLWVHRGVFGLHHHRYHDSEAFGSTSTTGALVYLDRMTHALQIRHPFGGEKPFGLAPEALKAYHEKALNEETEALAMLVSGITLTVTTMPVDLDGLKDMPEVAEKIRQEHGEVTMLAQITLSVPEKVDGLIEVKITNSAMNKKDYSPKDNIDNFKFKKQNNGVFTIHEDGTETESDDFNHTGNCFIKRLSKLIVKEERYEISFSIANFDSIYVPFARDILRIKATRK